MTDQDKMSEGGKPCPFCGGPAETRNFHINGNTQSRCARILCVGNIGGWNYTELWNARAELSRRAPVLSEEEKEAIERRK